MNTTTCPDDISTNRTVDQADSTISVATLGARKVSCKARGLHHDHITAYLTIPPGCRHGQRLKCSDLLCSLSKREFLFCKQCNEPFVKRNFRKEHSHRDSAGSTNEKKRRKVQYVGPDGDATTASCITIAEATDDKESKAGDDALTSVPCFRLEPSVNTSVEEASSWLMTITPTPTDKCAFQWHHSNPNYEGEIKSSYNPHTEKCGWQRINDINFLDEDLEECVWQRTNDINFLEEDLEPNLVLDSIFIDDMDGASLGAQSEDSIEIYDRSSSNTIDSSWLANSTFVQHGFDLESVSNPPSISVIVPESEAMLFEEIRLSPGTMKEQITCILDSTPRVPTGRGWREDNYPHNQQGERQEESLLDRGSRIDLFDQFDIEDIGLLDIVDE